MVELKVRVDLYNISIHNAGLIIREEHLNFINKDTLTRDEKLDNAFIKKGLFTIQCQVCSYEMK